MNESTKQSKNSTHQTTAENTAENKETHNATTDTTTHAFQTEVKTLLHLMVHSLYSNREIFLRELISNAADATDKLRFCALSDDSLLEGQSELWARIQSDEKNNTLVISDNGIGMNVDDVVNNLGTIAKSGTADFLQKLSKDAQVDTQLIGQFGVGFYSAFMVADKIEVKSRKAGESADKGVTWVSTGDGNFTTSSTHCEQRGTSITLHLKDDAKEFSEPWRLRTIINKFSDHIQLTVQMPLEKEKEGDAAGWQTVNKATALWTRAKNDISDKEYKAFYKQLAHDTEEPLAWTHNRVEGGKLDYTSLVYIPRKAPFDLWNRDFPRGLKLYVQRVFILDKAEELLPLYMRFVKGVVDSNDLPLNVSREILQNNKQIEDVKNALAKKILSMLENMAKEKPDDYRSFWQEFGRVIKEGVAEDFTNRETLLGLTRFTSLLKNEQKNDVSLDDYIARMQDKQENIYYLVGDSEEVLSRSPHVESCKQANIEVLLLSDRIDEWFMNYAHEYKGKSFSDLSRDEIDFDKFANITSEQKQARKESEQQISDLPKRLEKVYGDTVKEVKIGHHLIDSPACVMQDKGDMGAQMRRIMEATGQNVDQPKPILAINPNHMIIKGLHNQKNEQKFDTLAHIILDQALLSEGELPIEPATYVQRINSLLATTILQQ